MPRLENSGHRCIAIDLPGHGKDSSRTDVSLLDYVAAVIRSVESLSQQPILVGHSMGGVISMVAEAIPDRIRALVYVSALLLPDGSSMMDTVKQADPQYQAQLLWSPDGRFARLSPEGASQFLYPLCPANVVDEVLPLLTAEPVAPYETPIRTTSERFGRVPRYYIECLQDRIVPIALQRAMHSALPCKRVYPIDCDHAPYFSAPAEFASILHSISEDLAITAPHG